MSTFKKSVHSAGIATGNLFSWWAKRAAGGPNLLEINLSGQVEEVRLGGLFSRVMPSSATSMHSLLAGITLAAEEPDIKAVLLRLAGHDLSWGRVEEIAEAVKRFRANGKYAVCYLEEPENIDTMLASACDRILMPPGMPLYLTGLITEVVYFKELLDKLEVQPEFFQAGKYKSAVEPFTRKGMSKPHREAMEAMLDSLFQVWVGSLAEGRGLSEEKIKELIDEGPWIAEDCLDNGLVDGVVYEDEVDDYIEKWLGVVPRRITIDRFLKVYAPRHSVRDPWKKEKGLALVVASGPIHGGESRYMGAGEATAGSDTLRDALTRARENDKINSVVLRIDSPGGSATHSDLIWREVERLAKEKPVVVSMADVAASGGYYIAMPADHILANRSTLTGSIGVVGGRINFKGLYGKVGITKEHVARGRHAAMVTDYGAFSKELKAKVKSEMESIYKIFIDKAARGRKTSSEAIDAVAQGRVWTGEQAKNNGLVDELGGLLTAIERAKERAGIPISRRVPLFTMPKIKKISFPVLPFSLPLPGGIYRSAARLAIYEQIMEKPVMAMLPYQIKIR